jgi:hypothetical protein
VSLLWIIVLVLLAIVVVANIVDIFRRHLSTGATVGWIALILVLPFVGSLIYLALRKPSPDEGEQVYLAEADMRRSAERRPFDSSGMGP